MIFVDTSVWIDFVRGVDSTEAAFLESSISRDEDLCICGVILTELYQGIRSEHQYQYVKRLLAPLLYLPMPKIVYEQAAEIYRTARKQGKTIRNTIDCIIAACAIMHKVPLLQKDRDFLTIKSVSGLNLVKTGQ